MNCTCGHDIDEHEDGKKCDYCTCTEFEDAGE